MTNKTFERKFEIEVIKLENKPEPYDYLKKGKFKIIDKQTGSWSTYIWNGSYLICETGDLDMEYLDYLISRNSMGGPDFIDIVEEYLSSKFQLI